MRKLVPLALILLLSGCGMEAVNINVQARSESGLDQYPLQIVEGEYVCPHVVSINNKSFDVKAVITGEVEDRFGPFVACLEDVSGAPGSTGTCGNCQGEFKIPTGDEDPDAEPTGEEPTLAVPKLVSPHDENTKIDPTSVFVKGSKESLLGLNVCPTTKRNFTIKETDLLTTIDVHEEILDGKGRAIDPTINNDAKGGVVHLRERFEGPCWRCGGVGICPNCKGSGSGNLGIYDKSPAECWTCGTDGQCPECEGSGFSVYEGTLPKDYKAWGRENALPSKKRKWKYDRQSSGGGGGDDFDDEDMGSPEEDDAGGGDEDLGDPEEDG